MTAISMPAALIRSPRGWLLGREPVERHQALELSDVQPMLERIEDEIALGRTAIGYLAYEAARGFDTALVTHPPIVARPLAQFWVFERLDSMIDLPPASPIDRWPSWTSDWDATTHATKVAAARELIRRGDTYQVNLTWRLHASADRDIAWPMFHALYVRQPVPFAACLNFPDCSIASLSPELFFALDGERITTRPMKGTAPRSSDPVEDVRLAEELQRSVKNRAENVMIVDMLRNDLGRIARTGTVAVPRLFEVEPYATVHQMTSTITADTTASIPGIFRALFPCASITGAPKVSTMRHIAALETSPRGVYCGAIGIWQPGRRATFSVGIRTLVFDHTGEQATYGIGSGIVWDSAASSEYEECLLKARLLLNPAT